MSGIRVIATTVFVFLGLAAIASAQETGTIEGKILHANNESGLSGVNIVLKDTEYGASSNGDGTFVLERIPAGSYVVYISHIGFGTEMRKIRVGGGEKINLLVRLHPDAINLSEISVEAERSYSAASSKAIRQFDLQIRPTRSAQDLLQLAPGLVIAQHAGGGKAEQIFMRGFDADHGTDVAIFADGIPVNMVSHGHGQGYADLHFLIPEVVQGIDVYKGPYFARFGNLATAGAVSFQTRDHVEHNLVRIEGGEFSTAKLTTIFQIPTSGDHQGAYFAGQFSDTDGPVDVPQNFQRFNLFGKFHTHLSRESRIAFSLGAFSSGWDASGQIPQRAVDNRAISRFGSIDELEGGTTSRQNLNLTYQTGDENDADFLIQTYASRYNFKLFSNFTFFLNDAIDGDMIEQTDQRSIFGLNSEYRFRRTLGPVFSTTIFGGGFRADDIGVSLWKSPNRLRQRMDVSADIYERNLFLWAEQEFILSPQWRLQLGLRGDYLTFNVEDQLDTSPVEDVELPHASGYHQQSIVSPKLNLAFTPFQGTDIYLNGGSGFHSNDARNVVIAQRMREITRNLRRNGADESEIEQELARRHFDPQQSGIRTLPRAVGAELGIRTHLADLVVISVAGRWLQLQEELVFVGDEGTTEASGRTRRIGLDFEGRIQFSSWLWGDVDVSISDGRFPDEPPGADDIALAPRSASTGGITAIHPNGFEGSIRLRHIGDRPANESGTVTAIGYTVLNASFGYRLGQVKVFTNIENILDADWNEAQFDTESRLQNEAIPVPEIHFTPGNPRNIRFGISYES
jgi:outer membrane receptor protein involved in Fe transport